MRCDIYLLIKPLLTFDRPFGQEISYSSSRRESPERSSIFQTLFPDERDLGVMLTLQAPKGSVLSPLKLDAGLFAGNGIHRDTDNRKDFITHLSAQRTFGAIQLTAGVSYYLGSVYQGTETVMRMEGKGFAQSTTAANRGAFAKREYFGTDFQLAYKSSVGRLKLTAELLGGLQPSAQRSFKSPNASALPTHDTYLRPFVGGYAMLVHELPNLPLAWVLKYDWLDPNTAVQGDEVGQGGSSMGDLQVSTLGMGALWNVTSAVRLQAYYEINRNEISQHTPEYTTERPDNLFTLRLQYKF